MKKKFFKLFVTSLLFLGTGITACSGAVKDRGPIIDIPADPRGGGSGGGDTPGGDPTPTTTKVEVTYDANGGVGGKKVVEVTKGEATTAPTDFVPTRDGYVFKGWCTDKDGTALWDFSKAIKNKRTFYAGWTKLYTITFNSNGGSAVSSVQVPEGSKCTAPADPTKSGSGFVGWLSDVTKEYYFDFNSKVYADATLTAKWGATSAKRMYGYIFEAEYCPDIETMQGATYSGGAFGTGFIHNDKKDNGEAQASNGFYVQFNYVTGNNIKFVIHSDTEVTDAKMYVRLAGQYHIPGYSICGNSADARCRTSSTSEENMPITQGAYYPIKLNGTPLTNYGPNQDGFITFEVPSALDNCVFQDYILELNAHLVAGDNTLELVTENSCYLYGTACATAPMIDCVKIFTTAQLTFANAKESLINDR